MPSLIGAMGAAVSGVNAQTMRFGSISDNIANASSVGYKTSRVNFQNTLSTVPQPLQLPGTVVPTVHQNLSVGGALKQSNNIGDMSLLGNGFFAVANRLSSDGSQVAGNSDYALTRRGDFSIDKNGNLVNSNGMALLGVAIASPIPIYDNGIVSTPSVSNQQIAAIGKGVGSIAADAGLTSFIPIRIGQNAVIPAVTSSNIYVGVNLPAAEPLQGGKTYQATVNVTDKNGQNQTINLSFKRNGTVGGALPGGVVQENIWDVSISGANVTPASFKLSFDSTGHVLNAQSSVFPVTVGGTNMSLNFGAGQSANSGIPHPETTQLDDQFSVAGATTDGLAKGQAIGWSVSQNGIISQKFSNGINIPRYQIGLGSAPNNDGLEAINGEAWVQSPQSGKIKAFLSSSGVTGNTSGAGLDTAIFSGALEESTVDLATEFTNMIVTQRQYSANTKVMSVVDQMNAQTAQLGK
ncbi:MAG: flagellar hook-basal body complex protein [Alphaproteobacteria bacterium]|nr:flagellar hook-basal body complex protein [Alphaproteobacteria bacterium]